MQKLIAHFKERPKTFFVLLGVSVVLMTAWLANGKRVADREAPWDIKPPMLGEVGYTVGSFGIANDAVKSTYESAPDFYGRMMPVPSSTAGQTAADVDQKIIKTGALELLVDDVSNTAAKIGGIAVDRGGYVQSSSITEGGNGTYYGNIVVRVPVEKFESTMADLRGLATLVRNESSNGQDVTEQYTDLEAQLRNAKAQEETYLEVLKQARSVEDILKVQERLGSIRAQIESLQGRIQYLTNTTSLSTISVSLSEEPVVRAPTKEFRPVTIIKTAFQTLVVVVQDLIAGLIWLVIVWGGILLPIGLVVWLIVRAWKRRVQ
ncbi:MAG: DUF4349 domain-containing protein [Patescibacteria group bacterium]|jgi:hypothetical protein